MSPVSIHKGRLLASFPGIIAYLSVILAGGGISDMYISIAVALLVVNLWIAQAIPLWITSLFAPVLLTLHGVLDFTQAYTSFFNKTIALFLGGFLLAFSVEKYGLHRRFAFRLLAMTGENPRGIVRGMMLSTALISMWISNTATAILMLPVAVSIADLVSGKNNGSSSAFLTCLMLGIAYSANIGGIATIIGTPPNIVYKGFAEELQGQEISFLQWMAFGVPLSLLMLWIAYLILVRVLFPVHTGSLPEVAEFLDRKATEMGQMKTPEKRSLYVFTLAAFFWIFSQPINSLIDYTGLSFRIHESDVALIFGCLLFVLPSGANISKRLLDPGDLFKINWGILVLFGGGMCMARGLEATGAIHAAGKWISNLNQDHFPVLVLFIIASALFFTEVMSNVALAQIYIPVVFGIASTLGIQQVHTLGVPVAIACSFAFMMPVSTPPNAVVFGSGKLKFGDMMRAGFLLNIAGVIILWLCALYILPLLF